MEDKTYRIVLWIFVVLTLVFGLFFQLFLLGSIGHNLTIIDFIIPLLISFIPAFCFIFTLLAYSIKKDWHGDKMFVIFRKYSIALISGAVAIILFTIWWVAAPFRSLAFSRIEVYLNPTPIFFLGAILLIVTTFFVKTGLKEK